MRVICIDNDMELIEGHLNIVPQVGKVYTVIQDIVQNGMRFYELQEITTATDEFLYEAEAFIPISEIDETEMERNYKTEKV